MGTNQFIVPACMQPATNIIGVPPQPVFVPSPSISWRSSRRPRGGGRPGRLTAKKVLTTACSMPTRARRSRRLHSQPRRTQPGEPQGDIGSLASWPTLARSRLSLRPPAS